MGLGEVLGNGLGKISQRFWRVQDRIWVMVWVRVDKVWSRVGQGLGKVETMVGKGFW